VETLVQTQREALYYKHIQITIRLQPDPPQE